MKCECGAEFTGKFCPNCGKPAQQISTEPASQSTEENQKQTTLDKMAAAADKIVILRRRLLCVVCALIFVFSFIKGNIMTAIMFGAAAVLISPYAEKKYPEKCTGFWILAVVLCFVGAALAEV